MSNNSKEIKVVNIEEENLHICLPTWGNSKRISGKINLLYY